MVLESRKVGQSSRKKTEPSLSLTAERVKDMYAEVDSGPETVLSHPLRRQ